MEESSTREPAAAGAPSRPRVRLDPMTAAEYGRYLEPAIREYAHQKVISGDWERHEALELSRVDHARLLPDGLATRDQLLFTVRDDETDQPVGILWLALVTRGVKVEAYVYDVVVSEEVRGRGYGRATMLACLDEARKLGAESVGLHVFGHNAAARALYTSLGFEPTNIRMAVDL